MWYYWSLWSWFIAIFSQIMTLAAQYSPDYWTTTATVWLEFSQQTNIGVVIGFWGILFPMLFIPAFEQMSGSKAAGHYVKTMKTHKLADKVKQPHLTMNDFMITEIALNIYCHVLPFVMMHINIYYSDVKLQEGDWDIQVWTLFFYMFANFLGGYEMHHAVYPIIDWKSYPATIGIFCFAIALVVACNYGYSVCMNRSLKRRGEQ